MYWAHTFVIIIFSSSSRLWEICRKWRPPTNNNSLLVDDWQKLGMEDKRNSLSHSISSMDKLCYYFIAHALCVLWLLWSYRVKIHSKNDDNIRMEQLANKEAKALHKTNNSRYGGTCYLYNKVFGRFNFTMKFMERFWRSLYTT